ncbi:flagellar biosynthesis protein FlhB [Alkalihalobacillus pseudalcaliphilus]|uniref:flagellar biosynthesis protein FlhB n=1 Tax=Alkalihalobacillus pseudalcaliphilus TaxID=79884 RepID=UPI00064DD332|nr:flagellar biosynthesis protein FlhB [Alkalihalobacillus pseudalcaliphilus]KMK77231.1 flagellar biosynthesis protein FlhB [Alkalihalobacillus pseudalcaliphilus]
MKEVKINLQFFAEEKTEKATPKKRQDSRKKGQVAKSTDVNTAFILLFVFIFLWLFGGGMVGQALYDFLRHNFQTYLLMDVTARNLEIMFWDIIVQVAVVLLPIMLMAMVAGVFASFIQVGVMFTTEPLKFNLKKIDPIKGAKRIFSARALVELAKSLLKITFVGVVVFVLIWFNLEDVMLISQKSVEIGFAQIATLTAQMGMLVALLLLLLSVPDYIYQRYDNEKQMRMSKKDIKDEHKNMEGDPRIKSKRKQKQMEMAMQRMMQEVPKADVVITNPTHYAVALQYDDQKSDAPVVIAKGVDFVAQKIKSIATEHDVILVENKPLARALYGQTEIGDQVPESLFKAIAEVLAYVYRLKNKQVGK